MEIDDDEVAATYEQRMLDYAERQTRATERVAFLIGFCLFLCLLGAVLWGIAFFGN